MKAKVWICKRRTGCRKICPECQAENPATSRECRKCKADLRRVKRSFTGRGWSYSIRWTDPRTGRERSETAGPDRAYAKNLAAKRQQELLSGEYQGITKIDYDSFVSEHLRQLSDTVSQGSYIEHERTLEQFKTACHPADLTKIDFQMLEAFRAVRIADGISVATVNKCLRTLQAALQKAVERGYIKVNPFKGKRQKLFIREPEPVPMVLEPVDFQQLLGACPDNRWIGICTVAYFAGLRLGEILNLQWQDIDIDGKLLHVRNKADHATKGRKNRAIPLSAEIITALQSLRPGMFRSSYVFTSEGLEGRKMKNNAGRDFEVIVKRAGLVTVEKDQDGNEIKKARFTMHDLRRSFITNLLATGTDPKSVQVLAGHSSVQTTLKHYAAVRAKNLASAIDRLSKLSQIA